MKLTADTTLGEFVTHKMYGELSLVDVSVFLGIIAASANANGARRFVVRNRAYRHSHVSVKTALRKLEKLGMIRVFYDATENGSPQRTVELR